MVIIRPDLGTKFIVSYKKNLDENLIVKKFSAAAAAAYPDRQEKVLKLGQQQRWRQRRCRRKNELKIISPRDLYLTMEKSLSLLSPLSLSHILSLLGERRERRLKEKVENFLFPFLAKKSLSN